MPSAEPIEGACGGGGGSGVDVDPGGFGIDGGGSGAGGRSGVIVGGGSAPRPEPGVWGVPTEPAVLVGWLSRCVPPIGGADTGGRAPEPREFGGGSGADVGGFGRDGGPDGVGAAAPPGRVPGGPDIGGLGIEGGGSAAGDADGIVAVGGGGSGAVPLMSPPTRVRWRGPVDGGGGVRPGATERGDFFASPSKTSKSLPPLLSAMLNSS